MDEFIVCQYKKKLTAPDAINTFRIVFVIYFYKVNDYRVHKIRV